MSVITIQFGQCGNQVGKELYSMLPFKYPSDCDFHPQVCERWFRTNPVNNVIARAILVDTERKVVQEIERHISKAKSLWKYSSENIALLNDGGANNNWAYGYGEKGPKLEEIVFECVRQEAEETDSIMTFLNILSSAGGTGSGVGSYIIEHLRDEYSSKCFINCIILPYEKGEVVTQNYNSVLTLSKLYDVADCQFIFRNDHLHKMNSALLSLKDISLKDLNALIALKIMSVLHPVQSNSFQNIYDIATHLCSHPAYKFVTIKTSPHVAKESVKYESNFRWESLLNHIHQTLRISSTEGDIFDFETRQPSSHTSSKSYMMEYATCVSNLLITRGPQLNKPEMDMIQSLKNPSIYAKWIPGSERFKSYHDSVKLPNIEKFVSLASNNMLIYDPINSIVDKAWNMYGYKAYLHQYQKYNVGEEEFVFAFAEMENILKSYKKLYNSS